MPLALEREFSAPWGHWRSVKSQKALFTGTCADLSVLCFWGIWTTPPPPTSVQRVKGKEGRGTHNTHECHP